MCKRHWTIAAIIVAASTAAGPALASQMVYHPVNPTFGGNPLNGSSLLSTAQAQGEGVKSGSQGPDLSGLSNALSNISILGCADCNTCHFNKDNPARAGTIIDGQSTCSRTSVTLGKKKNA